MQSRTICANTKDIVTFSGHMLNQQVRPTFRRKAEKVTPAQLLNCLELPFRPKLTNAMMRIERFEDLPVDRIRSLVRGLIVDDIGTLRAEGTEQFAPAVIEKLREIRDKIAICVFSDDMQGSPVFEHLGIPIVRNVPPKTDPRSFNVAIQLYLQNRHNKTNPLYPRQCAAVGDNFLTDGSCRRIGMQFVHVRPKEGNESFFRAFTRDLADGIARFHDHFR